MTRLLTDWKMNYREFKEIECSIPCSMYSVLLDNNLMEHPHWRLNEQAAARYSEYPCEFVCDFSVDEQEFDCDRKELSFLSLDTVCEIRLNGKLLGNAKNMHLKHTFDVTNALRCGDNQIVIKFESPINYVNEMNNRHYLNNMSGIIQGVGHLRKGFYMFGWDWGPVLPDMGIYKNVLLELGAYNKIEDFYVKQFHSEDKVVLEIEAFAQGEYDELVFQIEDKSIVLEEGLGKVELDNPKLWWPRGYGEQNLYKVTLKMMKDGRVIDTKEDRIGLRTLTISTQPDKYGKEFCFVVNGVKIFAMGANYIPQENIIPYVTQEKTKQLIDICIDENFNCIRVWGGGYYPEDYFYDMCDEAGIIVWQDFMFACARIWMSEQFEESVKKEAIYQVKRLRNHASLGLLCGNNEDEHDVYYVDRYNKNLAYKQDYLRLNEQLLPSICEKYAPQTFYWPSSPSNGGGIVEPQAQNMGDMHYWGVWHGNEPYTEFRNLTTRFCSEYGMASYASLKTLKTVCEDGDLTPFSEVMDLHQKANGGNARIASYTANNYPYAMNFEAFIYSTQLEQADAVSCAIEHFRRNRGRCMGSLYWQLNDCWPTMSWASIDYCQRRKALHYSAKKSYAPIMLSLYIEDNHIKLNIANETLNKANCKVKYGIYDNFFNKVFEEELSYASEPLSANDILDKCVSEYMGSTDKYFAAELIDDNENVLMKKVCLFTEPKYYRWEKPNYDINLVDKEEGIEIRICSDVFSKSVELDFDADVVLSDNFIDLTDNTETVLFGKTDKNAEELEQSLKVKSVYDIR